MTRPAPRLVSAIGVTLAALGVVGAAGLPWGEHTLAVSRDLGGGVGEFLTTGWSGRLILGPLWLPNRLVVFAAGIVCWCCWLRAIGVGRIPAALPILFALYGVAHAGAMVFLFSGGPRARVGPGAPLAVLAFVAMLVLIARDLVVTPGGRRGGRADGPRRS
ncbi:hypothetical protein [Tautonia plasticadhaerens]|uniref:Uncharacterized protein n=1 Tax=Tautonia plasticadhaerens TaxID=2527974 RepID=A0A518H764_9BACT|nr:hypothetical protein [Tautonia plasticadhaerens]QDV36683.1 hypothetical protein ElP_46120 [Tautonia plasticadhaerens]